MRKDIIMPVRRPWTDKIFSGEKPFEFRNNPGKDWAAGSKIYIYESKANDGVGQVIGSVTIKSIFQFHKKSIGPPRPLLRYWAKHVAEDKNLCRLLELLGDCELPGYYPGAILLHLRSETHLQKVLQTGQWISPEDPPQKKDNSNPVAQCEDWLKEIGLISPGGTYSYSYAVQLADVCRYPIPQPLSEFGLLHAPQSWRYCPETN